MKSAAKLAALGLGLGLATGGCGSGTIVVALVSPTISQVSPQVVTAGTPSVTVTVQGQNFQSNASVTLNGSAMPTTVVNSTTLSAKISGSPIAQPAVAHLQVKNTNGGASNEVPLTVTSASQSSSLAIGTSGLPGAQSGTTYSAILTASGGTPGYTWSVSSGSLPAGVTLSSAGVISGTPTGNGTSTFAVTVSDSSSPIQSQTVTLSIVVIPATTTPSGLSVTSTALGSGQIGSAYNAALAATGGTPGYTWSLASGSLPGGLSLSASGVISGTPTTSGTSTFTVGVKDSGSPAQSASGQLSITVAGGGLAVHSVSLGAGIVSSSYTTTLTATGGTPGYTWSLASGSLPAGLTLSNSGTISGTPTASGTATFTVAVADSGSPIQTASAQESLTITGNNLTVTSTSLGSGATSNAYTTTLSASGGKPGYTWSLASGTLPAGLTLSSSGVISGTPTSNGTANFTVSVADSGSPVQTASAQESLTITTGLAVTSTNLGSGKTGNAYNTALSANGGTPGYTWTVSSGNLPAGLTLSSAGVISGTPTSSGTVNFAVAVTDSGSPTQTASAQESITVNAGALTITSANPGNGMVGIGYSVMLYASGGVPAYNWSISSGSLPAGLTLSSAGVISGTPTASGTSTFTLAVGDNESPAEAASAQESITINNATQSNPPSGAQLYLYPQAPIAPRGSYQTVTAIVTGVNDTTVTWSSDGGSIVGTNPCVVNEPCTIALYSTSTGTYHLTATSNANHQVVATSAITFTASPTPRMDHPRLLVTSDMLASLQAKATANNPMYQSIKWNASEYYSADNSIWTFSTWNGSACTGGSGPSSDQSGNYRENDAFWMAQVALFDNSSATRSQYGCAARDVFITNIQYVISGEIPLKTGNRWSDGSGAWAFTADLLMGGGFLSASDQAIVRQYLASLALQQVNSSIGAQGVLGAAFDDPVQFNSSYDFSSADMRAMGNNYTQARLLILTGAALTFNDNATDDPPLTNTCNATRYQVCPDGTAGSLHAYWSYLSGGLLYDYWADMEDPSVVQQAYNAAFNNFSSPPACQAPWGSAISCLGGGRGGEASEGTNYGNALTALREAMTAVHQAGYDDPLLYGPQISIGTTSYWDLRYVSDLTLLTGLSGVPGEQSRWNYLTDGDSLYYYMYPSDFSTEASMMASDSVIGRTDRSNALEWLILNSAFGTATGNTGNCISYCGFDNEIGNAYGSSVASALFVALPGNDPVANNAPSDPRQSLPTDWFEAGNQHIVTRTGGWTTGANTIFSYYCTNTEIDHEHQFCGGFDLYSNGEYITKGRLEFTDYDDEMSAAWNKNSMALMQYPGQTWCQENPYCFGWASATYGGQWWHGFQGGLATLYHSELPGYVAAIAEDHNAYNAGWEGYAKFNTVTAASRSLVYLRGSNEVIYYDRGETGSNAWDKATYLVTTGAPAVTGNTASWLTRSGNQKVYWTALDPSANTPQLDTTYTDHDATNDWEIYGRIKADAGNVEAARFLSVLQWGPSTFAASSATVVTSTAGTSFEGAMVGSSLVMFMHDWPATLTSVTYPASGATTQYVSDLTPNTTYTITGAGAPSTGTTDAAGVLTFSATGTGSITVAAPVGP